MTRRTTISSDLTQNTKFIDPRSGKVLREGSTPVSTVGEFKAKGTNVEEPQEDLRVEVAGIKNDMNEIKELLKGLSK